MRYKQKILGHKNIKTTAIHPPLEGLSASGGFIRQLQAGKPLVDIYHVTSAGMKKINRPLDKRYVEDDE